MLAKWAKARVHTVHVLSCAQTFGGRFLVQRTGCVLNALTACYAVLRNSGRKEAQKMQKEAYQAFHQVCDKGCVWAFFALWQSVYRPNRPMHQWHPKRTCPVDKKNVNACPNIADIVIVFVNPTCRKQIYLIERSRDVTAGEVAEAFLYKERGSCACVYRNFLSMLWKVFFYKLISDVRALSNASGVGFSLFFALFFSVHAWHMYACIFRNKLSC